ncbi:GNAT family N-acetyltransferase [Aequorivita capsosiphonis]|uniref:GNAT family N-acetyltransferase n=1 Tax=Aequorivita capsosiphonis TaxID=487317 RepID=UPI00041BA7D2|nr:GNAT family N-acetyltransferase [Aequorivita capsosiphonis]
MNRSITIREYKTTDKEELLDLIRLNIPEFFAPEEEADFKDYLETKRELYYVLLFNEKIVGCGGVNFEDNKTTGIISWDVFHPEYEGRSLGTQLIEHRIGILNSIGSIQKIIVRTSQVAYRFYEKQGFGLLEIKKDFWAKGFDMYYMELKN